MTSQEEEMDDLDSMIGTDNSFGDLPTYRVKELATKDLVARILKIEMEGCVRLIVDPGDAFTAVARIRTYISRVRAYVKSQNPKKQLKSFKINVISKKAITATETELILIKTESRNAAAKVMGEFADLLLDDSGDDDGESC